SFGTRSAISSRISPPYRGRDVVGRKLRSRLREFNVHPPSMSTARGFGVGGDERECLSVDWISRPVGRHRRSPMEAGKSTGLLPDLIPLDGDRPPGRPRPSCAPPDLRPPAPAAGRLPSVGRTLPAVRGRDDRSEEHTSELQSLAYL